MSHGHKSARRRKDVQFDALVRKFADSGPPPGSAKSAAPRNPGTGRKPRPVSTGMLLTGLAAFGTLAFVVVMVFAY